MPQVHTPLGLIHYWEQLWGALFSVCRNWKREMHNACLSWNERFSICILQIAPVSSIRRRNRKTITKHSRFPFGWNKPTINELKEVKWGLSRNHEEVKRPDVGLFIIPPVVHVGRRVRNLGVADPTLPLRDPRRRARLDSDSGRQQVVMMPLYTFLAMDAYCPYRICMTWNRSYLGATSILIHHLGLLWYLGKNIWGQDWQFHLGRYKPCGAYSQTYIYIHIQTYKTIYIMLAEILVRPFPRRWAVPLDPAAGRRRGAAIPPADLGQDEDQGRAEGDHLNTELPWPFILIKG